MNTPKLLIHIIAGIFTYTLTTLLHATAQPILTFIPTTPTTLQVPANGVATVQYRIINPTAITRTLAMVPIVGIRQNTAEAGFCADPFILSPNESCLLTLKLDGSQVPARIALGPLVCKTKSKIDNSPNPLICAQPNSADNLNITQVTAEKATLTVNPTTLTLVTNSGIFDTLTITNHSKLVTASHIRATLPSSWSDVTQDASDCVSVAPGNTCQLLLMPGVNVHTIKEIPITGDYTTEIMIPITVNSPAIAAISVNPTKLTLVTNSGIFDAFTITNHSTLITANNIRISLPPNWADVVQDASDCISVPPGNTCQLLLMPGNIVHTTEMIPITGDNTTQIMATIGVNPPATTD